MFGHLYVWNSIALVEALWPGGAHIILADAHPSPAAVPVRERLEHPGLPVLPIEAAVRSGEWILDVSAVLGRPTRGAAEVTRTGILHYARIACPVVSADDCRAKRIEGFFGTGEAFLRAWHQLRPDDPLPGKPLVVVGYGKIGRGVAHRLRAAGLEVSVAETEPSVRARAHREGFVTLDGEASPGLKAALANADLVIAVTGHPGIFSRRLPPAWLRHNRPVLVNLGAEDEFAPAYTDDEILGGRDLPLNFHLSRPTENRYVDPPLAAHLLALEALLADPARYPPGIHPLLPAMDAWVVESWRRAWPQEDLTGIADELGLSAR